MVSLTEPKPEHDFHLVHEDVTVRRRCAKLDRNFRLKAKMSLTSAAVLWGGGYISIPHSAARTMVSLTAPKPEHDFPLVHENVTVRRRCAKLDRNLRLKARMGLTSTAVFWRDD